MLADEAKKKRKKGTGITSVNIIGGKIPEGKGKQWMEGRGKGRGQGMMREGGRGEGIVGNHEPALRSVIPLKWRGRESRAGEKGRGSQGGSETGEGREGRKGERSEPPGKPRHAGSPTPMQPSSYFCLSCLNFHSPKPNHSSLGNHNV